MQAHTWTWKIISLEIYPDPYLDLDNRCVKCAHCDDLSWGIWKQVSSKSSALKCGENFILLLKSVLGAQCKTAQFLRDTHPLTFASGQKTLLCLFWNSNRDPGKANRFFLKFSKRVSKSQREYKCNSQTDESKMICFQVYWRIYESQTDHTFSLCMENNGIWYFWPRPQSPLWYLYRTHNIMKHRFDWCLQKLWSKLTPE